MTTELSTERKRELALEAAIATLEELASKEWNEDIASRQVAAGTLRHVKRLLGYQS